jgi:hypothetical protein
MSREPEETEKMPLSKSPVPARHESGGIGVLVAEVFRAAGWKVDVDRQVGNRQADLVVAKGKHRYIVELASASEGRRDRLVGLLSQAILQANSLATGSRKAAPLAIVAAPSISDAVQRALFEFRQCHVPHLAIGMVDGRGLRAFIGPGLESFNVRPRLPRTSMARVPAPPVNLFSDLNQWMLKVLLAPHIRRSGLMPKAATDVEYRNATALARAAGVSVMSAFRLLSQLEKEGFLDSSRASIRLVRVERLLEQWQASVARSPREWPARWVLRSREQEQLRKALEQFGDRACLGLFAAARALGLGHVEGVPVHLYAETLEPGAIRAAGLAEVLPGQQPDVMLRIPREIESVFRGAVAVEGVRVSDPLQVWLDVSSHPARGREQADLIFRKVIRPMIRSVHDQH